MNITRTLIIIPLALTALLLNACAPDRILIDLAPGDGRLTETAVFKDSGAPDTAPKVAMIDVSGMIASIATGGLIPSGGNPVDDLVARLNKAAEDASVRAIIIRVNSPGGTVAASETMYNEIRAFRKRTKKPVVISMAEVAASGGYYIALAGDQLVAQPSSVTGSIGVIFQTFNFSEGMRRFGIESRAVVSRPNKDIASPFEPPVEEHYAILQALVDDFYAKFRALVAERRPDIAPADMDTVTDGRVFTGSQALELHLVDKLGGVREAFEAAKALADLDRAQLVKYHAQGRRPNSAYALGPELNARLNPPQSTEINLVQLNLAAAESAGASGFYYLWTPALTRP
ncbi:MAG: signal peptide peptidase SppA [Phycisphaerales bacterium]|nr:signal peptide peptidase SppA [Phycisphaerales bacterium]